MRNHSLRPYIVLPAALLILLLSGSRAFSAPLGAKDELDLDIQPGPAHTVSTEEKILADAAAKPAAQKDAAPVPAPSVPVKPVTQETSSKPPVFKSAPVSQPAVKPAPAAAALPIQSFARKPETAVQNQPIKTWPIKVEDKSNFAAKPSEPSKAAAKSIEQPRPIIVKEPTVKKDVLKPTFAVSQSFDSAEKSAGVLNRWFGLETGAKDISGRGPGGAQPALNNNPDGIYTLKDCIDIAVKNSIPLQIAQKSVKLAEMRVMEARRNMLPSATVVWEPYTGVVNEQRYYGRKQYIEGKQPVYHGGELYFTVKQSETNLEITKVEGRKVRNELVLQVKKAYYTLAKAEDNLQIQRELSAEVDRIFQMVNDQYDAKVASKLEFLNVSSQASQIKYQLASADGDVDVAALILKQAMNVDPSLRLRIRPRLQFNKVAVPYDATLRAAFANRPEMIINTLMLDYYNYGEKIASSKGLPKVDLIGSWGLSKETYMPEDNAFNNTIQNGPGNNTPIIADEKMKQQWYAGVKASLPFWGNTAEYTFSREQWTPTVATYQGTEAKINSYKLHILDNLAMYSEKKSAEIDFDRARQELNKIRQDVTLEVKEQVFNYEKALIQLDTAAYKVKYQENDFEFTKAKRGLDEVQDSAVIDSMIKLSQERFGYVQALTDCHTAIASINKAVGIEEYYKDE